jgi:ferredoxin--NADP+ reductase
MTHNVAIIGAGPSGFYTIEALLKADPTARVDLIEALPTPFGLIRFGVAPDHQNTKRVTRAYERALGGERVRYFGNVQIGRDLSLKELRGMYDAVVLAVGAPHDRRLNVPGGDKAGVYGSAEFVSWYNGHPYFRDLNPNLDTDSVVVIGNGNVALDVARVLVKTPHEMASSDLPTYAAKAIHNAPIRQVHVFGRRGPVEAKFSNLELRELGRLEDAVPVVDPDDLPDSLPEGLSPRDHRVKGKNLDTLRAFAALEAKGRRKRLHFGFFAKPVAVLGGTRVEAVRMEHTRLDAGRAVGTGVFFEVPCGAVIAAVGYRAKPLEGVPLDEQRGIVANRDGRVAKGLYVVGWAKRGPSGVIGTNKPDGDLIAKQILADLPNGAKSSGPPLEELLEERGIRWVSFEDWMAIDAAERAAAPGEAPRRKLIEVEDMLAVLDGDSQAKRSA